MFFPHNHYDEQCDVFPHDYIDLLNKPKKETEKRYNEILFNHGN